MIIDTYHQLKTDLYTTVPDVLVCEAFDLPYRLVLWGGAIGRDEAVRRIENHGKRGMTYQPWSDPIVGDHATVTVIDTDDNDAGRTIANDRNSTCYRLVTPAQAEAEEATTRSVFPWRVVCRTRPAVLAEFDHLVESSDRMIAYHTGYRPDCPRWAPDISWVGTIYAVHVRDLHTATLLKMAIGHCALEGPGAA